MGGKGRDLISMLRAVPATAFISIVQLGPPSLAAWLAAGIMSLVDALGDEVGNRALPRPLPAGLEA